MVFSDDASFRPDRRSRPLVDTVVFSGVGNWNGKTGYRFEVRATDQGEPGRNRDTFSLVISDGAGRVVVNISDKLDGGNIESTRSGH